MTEIKTPDELAEKELNKKQAKSIANRMWEIRKLEAQKKKLEKQIEKIKSGELVPDEGSISTKDEDDESSSLKVIFLLDESGSMQSCKQQTITGFNEYLQTLKKENKKVRVSLTKFHDSSVDIVYSNIPVSDAQLLREDTYLPNGMTPLYDAIGKTTANETAKGKTLFVILTDGQENASVEFKDINTIKAMMKQQEARGWTFVYLGADQNAWSYAQHLGLNHGNVLSYNSNDTEGAYHTLTACSLNFMAGSSNTTDNFWSGDPISVNKKQHKPYMYSGTL